MQLLLQCHVLKAVMSARVMGYVFVHATSDIQGRRHQRVDLATQFVNAIGEPASALFVLSALFSMHYLH